MACRWCCQPCGSSSSLGKAGRQTAASSSSRGWRSCTGSLSAAELRTGLHMYVCGDVHLLLERTAATLELSWQTVAVDVQQAAGCTSHLRSQAASLAHAGLNGCAMLSALLAGPKCTMADTPPTCCSTLFAACGGLPDKPCSWLHTSPVVTVQAKLPPLWLSKPSCCSSGPEAAKAPPHKAGTLSSLASQALIQLHVLSRTLLPRVVGLHVASGHSLPPVMVRPATGVRSDAQQLHDRSNWHGSCSTRAQPAEAQL